jgi:hypothetical protein
MAAVTKVLLMRVLLMISTSRDSAFESVRPRRWRPSIVASIPEVPKYCSYSGSNKYWIIPSHPAYFLISITRECDKNEQLALVNSHTPPLLPLASLSS